MDYPTLVANKGTPGSIMNWLNDSSVDPDTILSEAQAHIYAKLRVQEMIVKDSAFAVTEGDESVDAPDGCLEVIHYRWLSPDLIVVPKITIDEVYKRRLYNPDGTLVLDLPRWFALGGDMIQFPVRCDRDRTAFIAYFQTPDPLSVSNPTNFVTTLYPRLLRTFCMAFGNEFKKEFTQANDWLAKGEDQLTNVAQTLDDERLRAMFTYPTAE